MIVQLPEDQAYGAAVVSGWTQSGDTETQRIAVVAKAAYDLEEDGGGPRVMTPASGEDRVEIVFADAGEEIIIVFEDGEDEIEVPTFDVTYEADIALEKARADVVVRGYMPVAATDVDGSVHVDGDDWMTRSAVGRVRDTDRNLFGFQPRMEVNREIDVDEAFVPTEGDRLPDTFDRSFNNFHRRGQGFGFSLPLELPSGGLVEVHQTVDQSDAAYAFILPDLELSARYRFHDGELPDKEPCWRTTELGPMRPDTLIVEPDTHRATILWRIGWSAAAQPFDAYRRVEITRGEA